MTYVYQGHIEKIPIMEEILAQLRHRGIAGGLYRRRSHRRGGDESRGPEHRPRQRTAEVKRSVQHVTASAGGQGAVREVCELLLKAQGHWDDLLRKYEIKAPAAG